MRPIHASYFFLVLVMEATTTKIPMVLHTTIVEVGMHSTLLPVVKPTRSRHGMLAIFRFMNFNLIFAQGDVIMKD